MTPAPSTGARPEAVVRALAFIQDPRGDRFADVALAVKWVDAKIDSTKIPYAAWTRSAADDATAEVVGVPEGLGKGAHVGLAGQLHGHVLAGRALHRAVGARLQAFPNQERRD